MSDSYAAQMGVSRDEVVNYIEKMDDETLFSYVEDMVREQIAAQYAEATRAQLMQNVRRELQQAGMTWEQFVAQNGGEQQFGMMLMMQTREVLVQGFCLDAVYRHEHMTLTDKDLEDACLDRKSVV